jgi:hypothetical protein
VRCLCAAGAGEYDLAELTEGSPVPYEQMAADLESLIATIGGHIDESKDNVGVSFLLEPRFLPNLSVTRRTGIEITPVEGKGPYQDRLLADAAAVIIAKSWIDAH